MINENLIDTICYHISKFLSMQKNKVFFCYEKHSFVKYQNIAYFFAEKNEYSMSHQDDLSTP